MNIIVCTALDLEIPCAAINRIEHLKKALDPLDTKIFIFRTNLYIKNYESQRTTIIKYT